MSGLSRDTCRWPSWVRMRRNGSGGVTFWRKAVGQRRDFALMMCAFLRAKGTAARVRCGFASYFGEGWEDHWV
jgi:hypothetical protein